MTINGDQMRSSIQALSMGIYVRETLTNGTEGKVMGLTSKGVFLLFGQRSIFITYSDHDSPFTIVLPPDSLSSSEISAGDVIYYSQNDILIPSRELTIFLQGIPVWEPPLPLPLMNSMEEIALNSQQMIQVLFSAHPEKGWGFLHQSPAEDDPDQQSIRQFTVEFTRSFQRRDLPASLEGANHMIGLGSGLTPSGDDWLTGFLLYYIRKYQASGQKTDGFVSDLGDRLVHNAYQKTTWVSANRMEASLKGWSEALFLDSIDHLFRSSLIDLQTHLNSLYNYGHSSGVDTLMGILAACKLEFESLNNS
jgi:hypothetical protein